MPLSLREGQRAMELGEGPYVIHTRVGSSYEPLTLPRSLYILWGQSKFRRPTSQTSDMGGPLFPYTFHLPSRKVNQRQPRRKLSGKIWHWDAGKSFLGVADGYRGLARSRAKGILYPCLIKSRKSMCLRSSPVNFAKHYVIRVALFKERKGGLSEFCTGGSTVENIVVKYGTKKFGHIYTI